MLGGAGTVSSGDAVACDFVWGRTVVRVHHPLPSSSTLPPQSHVFPRRLAKWYLAGDPAAQAGCLFRQTR